MPVENHEVHAKVKIATNKPYGCHNGDRTSAGYIGSPWGTPKFIVHAMSTECRYDMSMTDPRCENCKHRGSGETYAKMVTENGA